MSLLRIALIRNQSIQIRLLVALLHNPYNNPYKNTNPYTNKQQIQRINRKSKNTLKADKS